MYALVGNDKIKNVLQVEQADATDGGSNNDGDKTNSLSVNRNTNRKSGSSAGSESPKPEQPSGKHFPHLLDINMERGGI